MIKNIKVAKFMKITGKTIGTRIKQMRNIDSQEEMAKKTGISISALKNYELDKSEPSIKAIKKMVKPYGISPILIAFGDISDLINDEKKEMINRIMMLGEEEKNTLKKILEAIELQYIIKKQQENK